MIVPGVGSLRVSFLEYEYLGIGRGALLLGKMKQKSK